MKPDILKSGFNPIEFDVFKKQASLSSAKFSCLVPLASCLALAFPLI